MVWDSAAVSRNADLDLWLIEPDGNLYIPFLGTVTANGALSADSDKDRTYFEGYAMNRYVQIGTYYFYANLFADPQNYQPILDIVYRQGTTSGFNSMYAPNYLRMSKAATWLNDPTPTFAEADSGKYSDLVPTATLTITGPVASFSLSSASTQRSASPSTQAQGPVFNLAPGAAGMLKARNGASLIGNGSAPPRITVRQWQTVRANWAVREERRRAAPAHRSNGSSLLPMAARLVPPTILPTTH